MKRSAIRAEESAPLAGASDVRVAISTPIVAGAPFFLGGTVLFSMEPHHADPSAKR
jgi:hypothetical protein